MNQPHDHLIDHDLIDAAKDRHQAALARAAKVRTDLNFKRAAHVAARIASERAVADPSTADPHEADQVEAIAARAVTVAEKVAAAAESEAVQAGGAVRVACGEGYKPVYTHGVRCRLAAAVKADAARAMLAEAEQEYTQATGLLNLATKAGTPNSGVRSRANFMS